MNPFEPCQLMVYGPEAIANKVIDDRCILIANAILKVCNIAICGELLSSCSSLECCCDLLLVEQLLFIAHHSEHSNLD